MARTQRAATYKGNKGGECSPLERLAQCIRADWTCPYCGEQLEADASGLPTKRVHMDHVLAQVWGGVKSETNIVAACGSCNCSKKHAKLAEFATGKGDAEMVARVRRLQRRKLAPATAKAKEIMGAL